MWLGVMIDDEMKKEKRKKKEEDIQKYNIEMWMDYLID